MNKWFGMGRLTRDPEVRYGNNGNAIANFSLAVDRRFKRDGEAQADFFNFTAFGKTGEFVEKYLRKGTKVVVEAEVQNNNYEDKKWHEALFRTVHRQSDRVCGKQESDIGKYRACSDGR